MNLSIYVSNTKMNDGTNRASTILPLKSSVLLLEFLRDSSNLCTSDHDSHLRILITNIFQYSTQVKLTQSQKVYHVLFDTLLFSYMISITVSVTVRQHWLVKSYSNIPINTQRPHYTSQVQKSNTSTFTLNRQIKNKKVKHLNFHIIEPTDHK